MYNKKYTFLFLWMALLCVIVTACKEDREIGEEEDGHLPLPKLEAEVHKIWDEAPYSASSDLIRFNDAFYCAFREASEETGPGGRVRVIKSTDGETWETVQVFEFTGLPTPTEPASDLTFNMPDMPTNVADRQYMKIPHHTDFDFRRDEVFSLSAWVYRVEGSDAGGAGDLVSTRHANAVRGYNLGAQSRTLTLDFSAPYWRRHNRLSGTGYDPSIDPDFMFGKWEHVGFTYDGPNDKIWMYLNGKNLRLHISDTRGTNDLRETTSTVTEWNDYGNDITVFAQARDKSAESQVPMARFSAGKIRTLRFWRKAMSDAEMLAEYEAGKDAPVQVSGPDLIAGYDFDFSNIGWQDGKLIVRDVTGHHPGILYNFSFGGTPHADLQAPRLSIAPGNRLMLLMYGEYDRADGTMARRRPYISFSDDGENFSEMVPSEVYHPTENDLSSGDFNISGVTWDRTTLNAYGFDHMNPLTLFKTTNGTTFHAHSVLTQGLDGSPSDIQVRFDKRNKMYVLIRRNEGDQKGMLAISTPPYENFEYHPLSFSLYSAHFAFLDDNTLVMGVGEWDNTATMHVVVTDLTGKVLKRVPVNIDQESGYPEGMVVHDKYLWLSYITSSTGKSDVYMAKIPLDDLELQK